MVCEKMYILLSSSVLFCRTLPTAPFTSLVDHLLILQERQLQDVLNEYGTYFNQARPHQGIGQQIPEPSRSALSVVGGLYHDYRWAA